MTKSLAVEGKSDALLVKGRYVKLARDVSQTPWNLIIGSSERNNNNNEDEDVDNAAAIAGHHG